MMKKMIFLVLIAWGGWQGYKHAQARGGDVSPEETQRLAAGVKADDILIYSTSECPHCAEAKNWLHENAFAFRECNMSVNAQCEREFKALGATGTPYLIVRGHHMKDGFDSDEFLRALRGK